jgi:glycosyltransferase involved in cell wall biosynthesis
MLSWEYPPRIIGGLSRVVQELSKQLVKLGVEVHVVTADHPGTAEHEIDEGVFVHRVKTQPDATPDFLTWVARLNYGLLQYAIELHRKNPFDLIHAHDWMVADAAWVLKKGFGLPIIATMHATEAGRMHGLHNDLQRYIHQIEWRLTYESWEVIVNSLHMNNELQHSFGLPATKIKVIPNGINPEQFNFPFDPKSLRHQYASDHEQIVLYVGRMVLEKGVQILLNAVPHILYGDPNTKFLLVGTGYYLDELKKQAEYLGISNNVRFLGYVSDDELKRLYKIADTVCIPSLYEPFGIVALEGMAAKVPVVISDTGGLTDFVQHMVTGITTYAGDSGSLAWGLWEALHNKELAKKIADEAYRRVNTIYHWKIIAGQTLRIYERVLQEAKLIGADAIASQPIKPIDVDIKYKKTALESRS